MTDSASLQFKANTADLRTAKTDLDSLASSAGRAESAADGAAEAIRKMGKGGGSDGPKKAAQDLQLLLDKLNPTSKAFDDLDAAMSKLQSARAGKLIDTEQFNDFANIIERQRSALQRTYDEMTGYSEKVRQTAAVEKAAAAARAAEVESINRLRAALDPLAEAGRRAAEQMNLLNSAKKNGNISDAEYTKFAGQLKNITSEADKATISAGQLRSGWANATQQFIDFGVQLQSGQSPFTALVQQGPQLAYAFGSVGNTIEAFKDQFNQVAQNFGVGAKDLSENAGEVTDSVGAISESMNETVDASKKLATGFARFLTPMNLGIAGVVAAVAYLGYNMYQSAQQTELLNQSMAKTGYQAGVSAQRLKDIAASIKDVTDSSSADATKAVATAAAIATSADQLERYATVALTVSHETGEAVDDLVKRFAALADDPIKALDTLGHQFGILNPTLYDNVKALTEAGDKTGAYNLVLTATSDRLKLFSNDNKNSLGEVSGFWDNLIAKVGEYYTKAAEPPPIPKFEAPKSGLNFLDTSNEQVAQAQQAQAEQTKRNLKAVSDFAAGTLSVIDDVKKRNVAAAESASAVYAKTSQYELRSAKIQKDIEETQRNITNLKTGGTVAQQKAADALLATQRKQYDEALKAEAKKDAPKKEKALTVDAGDRVTDQYAAQNLALDAQIKMLQTRNANELNASQQRKAYWTLEAQFAVLEQKARTTTLTKQEQQLLSSKDQALAEAKVTAEKGDQVALLQRQNQIGDELQKQSDSIAAAQRAQADTAGLSTKEIERQVKAAEYLAKLKAQGATVAQQDQGMNNLAAQNAAEDAKIADWLNAGKTAFKDWAEAATNYAAIAKDAVTSAMDAGADAVANFALTGKLDFADFTKSILKMITEIISKLLVMQAVKAVASSAGGGLGGLFANAKGGVYGAGALSQYSNGVYDSPQMFQFSGAQKFAKGGVFGEAGPEAIMPLTRDANGRLGVKAEGGGGTGVQIGVTVNVATDGTATGNVTSNNGQARAIGEELNSAVATSVQKMMQPGGQIYKFVRG